LGDLTQSVPYNVLLIVVVAGVVLCTNVLQGRRADIADAMATWVHQEACDKRHEWWETSSWPCVYPSCIPQQEDGSSCGLYALVLAECLGAGLPLEHCLMRDSDAVHVRARLLNNISVTGAALYTS